MLASTVLYLRGAVVFSFMDRDLAVHLAPRLAALFAVGLAFAAVQYRRQQREGAGEITLGNPVELGRALALAAVFAGVILLARVAREWLGTAGLWGVGLVGGLADVDSVAVAAARLRQQELTTVQTAAGVYLLATVSNLVFKGTAVFLTAGAPMARLVLPAFAALAAATAAMLLLWP